MKRRFTILTAALALLVFMAPSMVAWGQTRTVQTATYGFETGDNGWTATTFVTNNTAITAHGGSKYGATNGTTADVKYNTIVANPQTLTCYYSKTTTNTNANSKFHIQVSSDNSTWTTVASGLGMDQVTKGTWYELTADLSSYSNVYVRVRYDGTTGVRALDDITLIYDDGTTPSTDPVISFNPASITLDEVLVGNQVSTTFSVSQANLTSGITLSVDNGSLSPSSIAQGAAATTVTWTYTPTTAGAISATVTATSGGTTETLAISGTAIAPVEGYDVDFEYATNMYPNWTFDNMTTYQTGSITAHGGTYYGTTGGKATASITTTSTVANPGTLTCYVSKQSGNTTSSTWYIQVSSDGSDWTEVETQSATSMSQGSWVEFSADLSSYTDVYVRVYYSGSTAIRNIDDLTLTIRSSVADPTFSPVSGTTFGNEGLSVTISQADNEDIYYTLDGTEPTTSSTLYSEAIALTATTTIKAIASDGTNTSNVVTATYTYVDPNAPGTVNNPYTVAQAIANTPSSGNVYIQGIVSSFYNTSIVGDGSNYRYYISDDGTTTTQLLVYKGKGLNQATFTNANDLLVGDEVVICGSLITYQNAPEIASGNYLYSWNRPAADVEAPTFSPVAGTYTEAQTVTISCATANSTIYYTLDGTEPTNASTQYTSALAISSTTTVKAIAYVGTVASTVATATYHFCSADNPYTVTEALAFNEYPANGIYVHGIVSTAASSLSSGTLTYYISDDGTTTNELEVYKGKDLENANFNAVDDIQVGDIVTVYGNVVIYGTTNPIKEFAQGNYLVSFERPTQQYTLTVTPSTNVEIYTFVSDDPTQEGQAGAFTTQVYDGTTVGISVSAEEGYVLTVIVDGTDVTSQLDETGWYEFTMPAHDVTVTATASLAPVVTTNTYTLATSIESGKQYIIVGWANGTPYAMGYQKSNNRHAVEISVTGDDNETASATIANTETNPHEFTITSLGNGYYSIMDATTLGGYLYAAGSSDNYLKTEDALDENHNGDWKITLSEGSFSVAADQSSNRNVMQFNNNNTLFACYASASQHPVFLYVKDETPVIETFPKKIVGYNNSSDLNYYLIASPVGDVDPEDVTNMLSNSYDLYYFDHTQDLEWINYKDNQSGTGNPSSDPGFINDSDGKLKSGKGYLYANSETVTLVFTGTARTDEEVEVSLDYDTTAELPGWNLVGNPYGVNAYLKNNRSFYTMDVNGNYQSVTGGVINPMEGIFVEAEGTGETVTFTTTEPESTGGKLALNLSHGHGIIDRAIVRFDGGDQLSKLQFRQGSTKVYIPMDGKDYAVVRSEEMGEMPVYFKAENNGSYTLNLSSENVEFAYLHLIDNLTGNEVDLLQTPSYSFEAKTTDYENRFKLVFATGSSTGSDTFAFYSNGSFVINNEGNATLQVVDVTGRIIKCESINGCANVNVNAAPGVYMLRLVNGDNMKIQKVVVK
jgi:hypothetical protein